MRVDEGCSETGVLAGDEAADAVERREAAMVRRMCDSVLSVAVVTHAARGVSCRPSCASGPAWMQGGYLDTRAFDTSRLLRG